MYLLPRGEQRAVLILSFLLIASIAARIIVASIPAREPPGLNEFIEEARILTEAADAFLAQKALQLNVADSIDLLPLPGIGPVFASRIIKYRELLGGYVSHDQLREVYGLPGETVEMLRQRTVIDTAHIRKINLDSANFRDLLRHPYLQLDQVKGLMEYRELMGPIRSEEILENNRLLPDTVLDRIRPYLSWGS